MDRFLYENSNMIFLCVNGHSDYITKTKNILQNVTQHLLNLYESF